MSKGRLRPGRQATLLGALAASVSLGVLLHQWGRPGEIVTPKLQETRFRVAVLSGPKQAAQVAPENSEHVVEAVETAPEQAPTQAAVASRETSLPEAVSAAQDGAPSPEVPAREPEEVIPPAQVSMPGGQLALEDAPVGNQEADPFAVRPHQVYLRLFVNAKGQVVRGGIVRSGGEPVRDALILKAMRSRLYATDKLLPLGEESGEKLWQLDLVLEYGASEMLP